MAETTRTPSTQIGPGVMAAAIEILDAEGPDGFTVRAIAERAGVAPMAIYNHFDGMNGLLETLWIQGFEALQDSVSIETNDPVADFMNAGIGYRAFALDNPGLYTLMFLHRFRNFEPSMEAIHIAARAYETLVHCVERCQAIGAISNVDASDAAQVVWSACHGYVALELRDVNFSHHRDMTYRILLETLRNGFR